MRMTVTTPLLPRLLSILQTETRKFTILPLFFKVSSLFLHISRCCFTMMMLMPEFLNHRRRWMLSSTVLGLRRIVVWCQNAKCHGDSLGVLYVWTLYWMFVCTVTQAYDGRSDRSRDWRARMLRIKSTGGRQYFLSFFLFLFLSAGWTIYFRHYFCRFIVQNTATDRCLYVARIPLPVVCWLNSVGCCIAHWWWLRITGSIGDWTSGVHGLGSTHSPIFRGYQPPLTPTPIEMILDSEPMPCQDELELQAELQMIEREQLARTLLERQKQWKLKEQGDIYPLTL